MKKRIFPFALLCLALLLSSCATHTTIHENYFFRKGKIKDISVSEIHYKDMGYVDIVEKIRKSTNPIITTACYLEDYLRFENTGTSRSFKEIHESGFACCAEYAIAAATLLIHHGYPPLVLQMFYEPEFDEKHNEYLDSHTVFLYLDKKTLRYGTLGQRGENILNAPFETIEEICEYFNKRQEKKFVAFRVHLIDPSKYNFIDGSGKFVYDGWFQNVKEELVVLNQKN